MLSSHHGNPHSRSAASLPDQKRFFDVVGGLHICKTIIGNSSTKGKYVHVAKVKALIHHQVIANHEP